MSTKRLLTLIVAGLLAVAPTAWAQQSAEEEAKLKAEQQMKQAEKQMQEAQRQMREAERQMREAAREMARNTSRQAEFEVQRRLVVYANHPRIGVILRTDADPKVDAIGAEIVGLTPGGPAEEAGVRVGDIVMKANGTPMNVGPAAVDEDESAPSARLRELVTSLKAGDKVELEIKRGSEAKRIAVTAEKLGGPMVKVFRGSGHDDFDIDVDVDIDTDGESTWVVRSHGWWEMELTSLNPELGEYFGTTEGVLVTRPPKDDTLKLKAGDVILRIGDRPLSSPSTALRVLSSYDKGETVTIDVLRKREKLTLTAQVPASMRHGVYVVPRPPAPPAPPAPAAAPAAPAAPAPPAPPTKKHNQAA